MRGSGGVGNGTGGWGGAAVLVLLLWAWGAWAGGPRPFRVPLPAMNQPRSFAVDRDGRVWWVEDLSGRVLRGRPGGRAAEVPGVPRPAAVAAAPEGAVLVLHSGAGGFRLALWAGGERRSVPLIAEPPLGDPAGMAARDGIVWVVDRRPRRVVLFAYDGSALAWTDLSERARAPFSVALGPAGEGYVTDPAGPAVLAFNPSGAYLGTLDVGGTGLTRPTGVTVDGKGRVWVSDGVTGVLVLLDPARGGTTVRANGRAIRFADPLRLRWRKRVWVLDAAPGRMWTVEEPP
ncbi:NHL repeat-containing protein [Deferrisoma camini]|uniref:hypothetical protein n=1 Tax=Deferrisoma camini TaxID=1035120 RepID=UPI00046CDD85|nr:hypothetical protein [Deferrisoma camini]